MGQDQESRNSLGDAGCRNRGGEAGRGWSRPTTDQKGDWTPSYRPHGVFCPGEIGQ